MKTPKRKNPDCIKIYNSLCWLMICAQNACDSAQQACVTSMLQRDIEDLQQAIKKAHTTILQTT